MVTIRACAGLLLVASLAACGGSSQNQASASIKAKAKGDTSRRLAGSGQPEGDRGRCDTDAPDRETSEYDTNGDQNPDVRKVFLRQGEAPDISLVLVCREADLNGDGIKDIVRYYNDDGRPVREEADRNFDGQMDEISYFEEGRTIRQELDTNGDGQVDAKVYYEDGVPVRAERDLKGRSTADQWRPSRWEYYEHGRLVRMGTDLDGDGRVDRWDRNEELRKRFEKERGEGEEESAQPGVEDVGDASAGTGAGAGDTEGASGAEG